MKIDGVGKVLASKIDEILTRNENSNSEHHIPMQTQKSFANVGEWLQSLGLECYQESFVCAGYDNLVACQDLTDKDLDNIKAVTKPGHRKTLLNASRNLSTAHVNTFNSANVVPPSNAKNTTSSSSITSASAETSSSASSSTTKASYIYRKNGKYFLSFLHFIFILFIHIY